MKTAPPIDTKAEIEPSKQLAARRYTLEPVGIPVDARETVVWLSREGWPDFGKSVAVVRIEQYFSYDGGATWTFGGACTKVGGQLKHWSGKNIDTCGLGASGISQTKNPDRQIRVEIIPLFPITTKVDLECRSIETIPDPVEGINGRLG